MRTRLSICVKKRRFPTKEAAQESTIGAGIRLRAYHCDRCFGYHLTSRMKARPPR